MGTKWAGYSPHSQRFVYSKSVKNAQKEAQATKSVALTWFCRYRTFDTITPDKSYAQGLKINSTVPVVGKNVSHNSKSSNKNPESSFYDKTPCSAAIHTTNNPSLLTVTITLHNKFQCLQNLCASTDDVIHNEIHMTKSVNKHRDNSVRVSAVGDKLDHVKQHLEECKLPQSCSNDMLQPILAVQEKIHCRAIKTKLGYSMGFLITWKNREMW